MFTEQVTLLEGKNWSLLHCHFNKADELLAACSELSLHERPVLKPEPKETQTPEQEKKDRRAHRNVGFYSDVAPAYYPSKQSAFELGAQPLTRQFRDLLEWVNEHWKEQFDSILVNEYPDEKACIGPHYDGENGNGAWCVVTISLGATRTFALRSRETRNSPRLDFPVVHGSAITMTNTLQMLYTHEVPPSDTPCGRRVSLTFRRVGTNMKPWIKTLTHGPRRCLVCAKMTIERSGVCADCYQLKSFMCPTCKKEPTGAPWPCEACFLEEKLARKATSTVPPK